MTHTLTLTSPDGFAFPVYEARPAGTPRGAIVVAQEIFGVNANIRAVADGYAAQGFLALAPAAFHRVHPGVELGYTQDDIQQGVALKAAVQALPAPGVMADLETTVRHAASAGKVGMVGYCWGGLLTWRSAALVPGLSAAVAYYGGGMTVGDELRRQPACAVQCHFGDADHAIPNETVAAFRAAQPGVEVHVYAAQHGFNCDHRGSYDATAAALALERSLAFFARHVG